MRIRASALLLLAATQSWPQDAALESRATALIGRRCLSCHDAATKTAGLDLTRRQTALAGGKSGPALAPGSVENSLAARKIAAGQMPVGAPLPEAEREIIFDWIRKGAPWSTPIAAARKRAGPDWWSLQPLGAMEPPALKDGDAEWSRSAIDRFLFAELRKKGLHPSPPADRRTWIRRATFDLTGLPPSPAEVEAFVNDPDPAAYEHLIDRLLASPRYGERWGRHWLDVVRFGESDGYEKNILRDRAWPYRDYVIRSFNQDKPFNRMILEQLAADQIAPGDPEVEVATGFLVAGPHDTVKIQNIEGELQKRADDLDDILSNTAAAFLGLTVNCARCHDHKFDPIQQADYYRLQAVFAGVEHAERDLAGAEEKERIRAMAEPLKRELATINARMAALRKEGEPLVERRSAEIAGRYRSAVDPKGTEEKFDPARARYVRMTITETLRRSPPALDELEIWTAGPAPANVALASRGAKATARSTRSTGTAAEAYNAANVIDGSYDKAWISAESGAGQITIELPRVETVARVFWSRDRQGGFQGRFLSSVPTGYVIEGSLDGTGWKKLASSEGRLPYGEQERNEFFLLQVFSPETRAEWGALSSRKGELEKRIEALPKPRLAYIGRFEQPSEPTHLLKRGNPTSKGEVIAPASLSTLSRMLPGFELDAAAPEGRRRLALARWIVDDRNALTPRVLANRVWQYHFGTGLVATPSDFGFNGERPSHPELLDWLARRLQQLDWKLKPFHRELMLSAAYRQSAAANPEGLAADAGDRLLWRFPPRRLEAEELRDAVLAVSGKLDLKMGGPGFRLYNYTVDNVATYLPADTFPPETWRRAVYQQSARSVKDDMLSSFDCPDSSLAEPRRVVTITPLQALTLLNSRFMLDQSRFLAGRLKREAGSRPAAQIDLAFRLAFGRAPRPQETSAALELIRAQGLFIFTRALLNANEFIYVF